MYTFSVFLHLCGLIKYHPRPLFLLNALHHRIGTEYSYISQVFINLLIRAYIHN